jgi:hypothetical protein
MQRRNLPQNQSLDMERSHKIIVKNQINIINNASSNGANSTSQQNMAAAAAAAGNIESINR